MESPLTPTTDTKNVREADPVIPGILVDPEWLGAHIGAPSLKVVDLRDRDAYGGGFIPGAVQLDLEDLGENRDGCDNVVLGPIEFERLMARLGISNGDIVVVYDDHWGLPSARLVWALHLYGERAVGVLNGGWDRWQEEGRPVTAGSGPDRAVVGQADAFEARPTPEVAADYAWISGGVAREDRVLLDTRSQAEFTKGHLPGAISWDWFTAVPAGSWECARDPGELRSELAALGVHPSDEVVTYCRSGMRAAHTYVVLQHAGFPRVRLYDGSWQDWAMRGTPPDPKKR